MKAFGSIVLRKEHRREQLVSLCNYPEFLTASVSVNRKDSKTFAKRSLVFRCVLWRAVAPVPSCMTPKGSLDVREVQFLKCVCGNLCFAKTQEWQAEGVGILRLRLRAHLE